MMSGICRMSFHITNYGSFGGSIPRDIDGFAHTTQAGWMRANIDEGGMRNTRPVRLAHCKELATRTRDAVKAADRRLAAWRSRN